MQRSHSFAGLKSWFAPPDRLVQVARITGGVVILAGCLVLLGWKLDLEILKSVIPGAATTKANTAICFLLAGISLSFQTSRRTRLATQLANGCAIAVSTIGLLTLSEYMFGWHLGIDELLVRDPAATLASDPGRMGLNAAIDFSLVGIALWLANRQEPQPPQWQHRVKLDRIAISQSLATVAGFIALQAVVSYANNDRVFYQLSIFTTEMTLQTAIVFVVLCGGILALSSQRGWMRVLTSDLVGGDVARRFVPIAIVVPLVLGWLILRGHQANFYDTNLAFSLMSISLVAILLGLIWLNAGILDRVDYDRIRLSDRIRSSEERLQLALQGANQGIWELDIQTQVVTWDARCKAIFGLSPDVILTYAQRIDMLHPDDRQRVADALTIAAREGGAFVQEYRTICPNGKIRWVLSQGRGYYNAAGQPDRMSGTMMDITDRKQIEATMQQQLGEIEAIYRAAPIGLCYVNTKLEFVRINERLAQIDGSSVSGHLGRKIRKVLPEMAHLLEPIYQQVIDSGTPILDLEMTGTTSAQPGVVRYWLGSYYPQTDTEQRVVGVNVMVQEISERKQAEAALRESNRKFSAVFDQTFELVGLVSVEGVLLEVNQTALASIDARKSEIVGKWFWETPWWHTEQLQQQLKDAIVTAASGQLVRYEMQFINANEILTTIDFSLKPVFDEQDRVMMLVAEGSDITARKQAEATLRESEERFRTLADRMSQFAWMADASGGIFWYNRRWFDYTGTTLEQMQGWGWQQVHHPEHVERVVAHFRHSIEIGAEWEDTFPLRGHDGMYRWFLSRAIPIRDDSGQIVRWFGTNTDITERQTALREIEQAQADLARRNQELDAFVYIVAHDLKAPLRGISNLSQWIEDDLEGIVLADTQSQMLLLRSRVRRMEATIDGLLDYARIGRTDAKIEPVPLAQLLAETIDSIDPPPTFTIIIAPDLPTLNTKWLSLFQVFTNLISNAIKHHHRADGSLHIFGRDVGDLYEFVVADDGPGIAPEQHDKIFEIFQAVNPQQRSDSTGIGLSIVKKIIETEGGTIRLESQATKGATFYFTWPKQSGISAL